MFELVPAPVSDNPKNVRVNNFAFPGIVGNFRRKGGRIFIVSNETF